MKRILELKKEFYSKDNIIKEFQSEDKYENVVLTWEVKSSLITCEAIIRSALMRQESRGVITGLIFQILDDEEWKCKYLLQKGRKGGRWYCLKDSVKEIEGPLADLLKIHVKGEHHREFE